MPIECPRCAENERQIAKERGRLNRHANELKSQVDLLRRQLAEARDGMESNRQAMMERLGGDINLLIDQKDQEITFLRKQIETMKGKRSEETQEEEKPGDPTRFSLLEVD